MIRPGYLPGARCAALPPAPPRPRAGGRLAALVRRADELRDMGWDARLDASVRASLAHALFTDIGMRRGPGALWRHAPRALKRALEAEVHYGPSRSRRTAGSWR